VEYAAEAARNAVIEMSAAIRSAAGVAK
jgi:hypothetical protein